MGKYRHDAKQLYTFNLLRQKDYEVWFTSLRKGVIVNPEACEAGRSCEAGRL